MSDYISRADAIEAVKQRLYQSAMNNMSTIMTADKIFADIADNRIELWLNEVPSAEAESDDLIIKGAKGIKDGLYNIKDGKLFKYKAKGGTVRTYPIVPSADAVHGEWVCKEREYNDCDGYYAHYWYECSVCGARPPKDTWKNEWHSDFCPSCGARMKGGDE